MIRGGSFWIRIRCKKGKKCLLFDLFIGIQRGRLTSKVRSGEALFGPELDGEKLWRRAVCSEPGWAPERKEKCDQGRFVLD